MRVVREFIELENRYSATVDIGERPGRWGARFGCENGSDPLAQFGPVRRVELLGDVDVFDAESAEEVGVELRFDGADGEEPTVGARVGTVERRVSRQDVPATAGPDPCVELGEVGEVEQRRAVGDRRVDNFAPAGAAAFVER